MRHFKGERIMSTATRFTQLQEKVSSGTTWAEATDLGHVLIVDDDPEVHPLFNLLLRPLHLDVRYASNGYEALEMVASDRPGLIILDLRMPGLDGLGVLKHLGETAETADIPVMIFSANVHVGGNGYEWPPQVIGVLEKSTTSLTEIRDLVKDRLHRVSV
jgi:DNA-binding NtrC family response regulator